MLKISCITLVIAVVISLVYILYLKKNIHKYEMILTDIKWQAKRSRGDGSWRAIR